MNSWYLSAFSRLLGATMTLALFASAQAADYPVGPVKVVIPYAAGGPVDVVGRIVGQALSESLGKPVLIDNRPGAGTSIGAASVATSAPDGYTLLLGNAASHAMNPALNKLTYNPVTDFEPIGLVASMPFVLVVSPTLPPRSVAELIAFAKQKRDLSYASAGSGSSTHLVMELFKQMTGIEALHVPYKARAPAEADVMAGRVSMMFDSSATAVPRVIEKTLIGLGVTSTTRLNVIKDVPTIAEATQKSFAADMWVGLFAPAKTPAPILALWNKLSLEAAKRPEVQQRLLALGAIAKSSTREELGSVVRTDLAKWTGLIKQAGIKPE